MLQFKVPYAISHERHISEVIADWLESKFKRSGSARTREIYAATLTSFRASLPYGIDLDADAPCIASLSEAWASEGVSRDVSATTFNHRLSVLSSFYRYATKQRIVDTNPVDQIERRIGKKTQAARPLVAAQVKQGLQDIDRRSVEGLRDYALLGIALATGRRASELVALRYGDIQKRGTTCTLTWRRCKGNVEMRDVLSERMTSILYGYLHVLYGATLGILPAEAPIWVSLSDRNAGQAIGYKTLQRICKEHLGTSKVHTTRHTWAVTMHKKGASLAEIGRGLGHSNLKTTSDYLEEQLGYENAYASAIEDAFGM